MRGLRKFLGFGSLLLPLGAGCAPGDDPGLSSSGSASASDSNATAESATDSASGMSGTTVASDSGTTAGGSDSMSTGATTSASSATVAGTDSDGTESTTADTSVDSDGSGGGSSGTGGASASASATAASDSATAGGSTGDVVNPFCNPDTYDHPCAQCAVVECCELVVDCLLDNICLDLADCIDGGGTFEECEMTYGQSDASMAIRTCAQAACVECN